MPELSNNGGDAIMDLLVMNVLCVIGIAVIFMIALIVILAALTQQEIDEE